MTTGFNPAITTTQDGTYRLIPTVLPPAEKTAAITKVRYLERELFRRQRPYPSGHYPDDGRGNGRPHQ